MVMNRYILLLGTGYGYGTGYGNGYSTGDGY